MIPSARAYWACQLAGWAGTAAINVAFSAAYSPDALPQLVPIYVWASVCGIVLSHQWRHLLGARGWLASAHRLAWGRLAAGIVTLAVIETLLVALGFAALRPPGSFKGYAWIPNAVFFWTVIFVIWTALYVSVSASRRASRLQADTLQLAVHAKEAELRALQAQVNPHFFFNSLNSIRALIYENPDAAARMVDQLAAMMRYTLQAGGARVPLSQEMAAVKAYLDIEKIRFEDRLRTSTAVEPGLEHLAIPPMALQALVENAVKYGVERNSEGGEVRIRVDRGDSPEGAVRIEVANRGALAADADSTRVGLENTRRRLALAIGAQASVDLVERDGWVVATLVLPAAA